MSDGGTTHGADASFLTSSAPSVATGDASSIAPTSARLNGVVTPNGLATTWRFDYGTTTSTARRRRATAPARARVRSTSGSRSPA